MRRIVIVLVGLALASCGFLGGGPLKSASTAAHDAADKFAALAKGSETSGLAPRQTDPTAGPLLDKILNTAALPTAPNFDDLEAVSDWMGSVARVGQIYTLAGTGVTDISAATPQMGDQVTRNLVTYAPEFGRYIDAELAIMRLTAAIVTKENADHPEAMQNPTSAGGLVKMRAGFATTLSGVLSSLATPGLTDDWRRARMASLMAATPDIAKLLTPDTAQALSAEAGQAAMATNDPQVKAQLAQFAGMVSPGAAMPAQNAYPQAPQYPQQPAAQYPQPYPQQAPQPYPQQPQAQYPQQPPAYPQQNPYPQQQQ